MRRWSFQLLTSELLVIDTVRKGTSTPPTDCRTGVDKTVHETELWRVHLSFRLTCFGIARHTATGLLDADTLQVLPTRRVLPTAMRRSSKSASLGRRQAHLPHDGLIARIGVQEVKVWIALDAHQVGRVLLIGLFQVMDSLVLTSQVGIGVGEIDR